jgi:creatinine amidohydrolase
MARDNTASGLSCSIVEGFQMKLFAELNREQIRAAAADSLVILPIGATEQHGPHLATGMDYFTVESIARQAAVIASAEIPIMVTPALPFGSSHHHFVFGGTLSLSTETYYRVLYELVESLVTDGFTTIFLLNGHGGNHELAQLAVRDIVLKHPGGGGVLLESCLGSIGCRGCA